MKYYCDQCHRSVTHCRCEPCGHPGCNKRRARPHLMFCEDHLVGELTTEPVERPTTEDLAAEHDEVLAEVSEALRMYHSYLQSPEAAMLERAKAKEAEAKARLDAAREEHSRAHKAHFVAWDVVDSTWKESRKALANLSPEAREQLESRRVVILDGTTYIVDASGDELQLLVSDPWVIS